MGEQLVPLISCASFVLAFGKRGHQRWDGHANNAVRSDYFGRGVMKCAFQLRIHWSPSMKNESASSGEKRGHYSMER